MISNVSEHSALCFGCWCLFCFACLDFIFIILFPYSKLRYFLLIYQFGQLCWRTWYFRKKLFKKEFCILAFFVTFTTTLLSNLIKYFYFNQHFRLFLLLLTKDLFLPNLRDPFTCVSVLPSVIFFFFSPINSFYFSILGSWV